MGNGSMRAVPSFHDFEIVAKEYERLRAAGLALEEIHSVLAVRLEKSMANGPSQTADLIGTSKIVGPAGKEDAVRSVEQTNNNLTYPQQKEISFQFESKASESIQQSAPVSNGLVLLIDDSPVAAKVASKVLTGQNFEVVTANSAKQGFDILLAREGDIDLIFLDVVMPNVDGVECLGWIKDCPDVAHIPVYMLSGLEDQMLSEVCVERGAEGMLLKPLKPDLVQNIMKSHNIGHQHHSPPAPAAAAPPSSSFKPTPPSTSKPAQPTPHAPPVVSTLSSASGGVPVFASKALRSTNVVSVGSQAPAFKLLDSDMKEYIFPLPNVKKNTLLLFLPTLYVSSFFDPDAGFLRVFHNYYEYLMNSKKVNIACISGDLPFALAAGKKRFNMPFTLLSDPSLVVSQRYVGTIDIGKVLCKVDSEQSDNREDILDSINNRQHSALGPNLGIVLLSRNREVLCKWVGNISDTDTSPNLKQFPPNFDHWLTIITDVNALPLSITNKDMGSFSEDNNNVGPVHLTVSNSSIPGDNSNSHNNSPAKRPANLSTSQSISKPPPPIEQSVAAEQAGKKIVLIVDDSSISSRIVCKKLEDNGFAVKTAYNGQIAYEQLKKAPKSFDVVLTDVVMPVCDGLTLLRLIKSDREMEHLPVIMLSGLEGEEIRTTSFEQGAIAVMNKPFDLSHFKEIVKSKLNWENV